MEQIKNLKKINFKKDTLLVKKLRTSIVFSFFAFLMGRLSLTNGIAPFAQSFVLGTGNTFIVLLSALAGLLSNSGIVRRKYALMLIFSFTVAKLLKLIFPKADTEKLAPFVLLFSTLVFGLIFVLFTDFVIFDILLVLLEAFISFAFYFITLKFVQITDNAYKKYYTSAQYAAPLCILCVVIAGIGNIPLPWELSFKNLICIYLVLISSLYANTGMLAQVAVFAGIAAGAGSDYFPLFISYYAVDALFCSVFAKYGKVTSVLGFVLGNIFLSILLSENNYMVIGFQDIALSALIFTLTPEKQAGKLKLYFSSDSRTKDNSEAIKSIATVKLERLSSAFLKLADSINLSAKKGKTTLSAVYDSVADKVCGKCAMRFYCWQKDQQSTTDAFLSVINNIKTSGSASEKDFPDYFRHKCIKTNEILNAIISSYEILRLNTVWQNKMKENAEIYREQFCELSGIVRHLKSEIDKNPCFDKNLSDELVEGLESEGYQIKQINLLKDHNDSYQVDLTLFPCGQNTIKCYDKISSVLENILNVPFSKKQGKCSFKECRLIFGEAEIYSLEYAVRQNPKTKNDKCGDSYSINLLENGCEYIALCDGSGSGSEANEYSSSTLRLLEGFLKTGFSETASMKLINSSFINSNEQDYFSTIDLGVIDLKNGSLEIVKKGAAPTYIIHSDGEYEVIKINTLPIGVFNGEKGKIRKAVLRKDDIIVMVSDGITDALSKEDWIIDALSAINSKNPEYIAETIMKIARTAKGGSEDDKTVIVAKMRLTDEKTA